MTIAEALKNAYELLSEKGIAEPRREASSLMAFTLGKDVSFLIAHPEYKLGSSEQEKFEVSLNRRANHEPFQYITGKQEFYGLDFEVTPDVLIPRPETELIVENALKILSDIESPNICEVGIGSGCILVSTLKNSPTASGIGSDISDKALKVAESNAIKHEVINRLDLRISNVFEGLNSQKFDLIISNPPYVPAKDIETLQAEVRYFEPKIALTDGSTGLTIIQKLVDESPKYISPGGYLLMEIGFNQSARVETMFSHDIWQAVEFIDDLQGIPRMLKAKLKS